MSSFFRWLDLIRQKGTVHEASVGEKKKKTSVYLSVYLAWHCVVHTYLPSPGQNVLKMSEGNFEDDENMRHSWTMRIRGTD